MFYNDLIIDGYYVGFRKIKKKYFLRKNKTLPKKWQQIFTLGSSYYNKTKYN